MPDQSGRTPSPGACADPACQVLHADPANPIHPPFYEPGGPFMDDECADCGLHVEPHELCECCEVPDA